MAAKKALGYIIILLLAAGVITTLLVVLMVPSISESQNNEEIPPPEPTEPPQPTETPKTTQPPKTTEPPFGNGFAYAEVPGFGSFKGYIPSEGAGIFAGIPYSQPPVGEGRWKKPTPLSNVNYDGSYYDATFSRPGCPQICELPSPEYVCPNETDEDCLHINVYVPKKLLKSKINNEGGLDLIENIQDAKIPVMVFMYGGAFIAGGNGVTLYDARFLAEKGEVIVVVPNYRVGPFGFFYQNNGTSDPALGNFGIWDQIEALRWVKDRIKYFGGDPTQVTIFGQSAGAQSVAVHLVNNQSNPLFKAAILESNPFGINYKTTDEAQDTCDKFVNSFTTNKCTPNDMECLRNLTMDEILVALGNFSLKDQFNKESISQVFEPWAPIIDNEILTEHPFYTFNDGRSQDKPILHGTTKDEGMFFIIQASKSPIKSNTVYDAFLRVMFGKKNVNKIKEVYPPNCPDKRQDGDCDNRYPINDIVTDYLFTCPSRQVFNISSKDQDAALKVWWYTFDQVWSFPQFWENYTECADLVCHSAELPYVFDLDHLTEFAFTEEESLLADKMVYYWSNFAKYSDPNPLATSSRQIRSAITVNKLDSKAETFPPKVVSWPTIYETYEGSAVGYIQYQTMNLTGSGEAVVDNFMKEKCDFWDSLDLYLKDEVKIISRPSITYELKKIFEGLDDS